MVCVKHVELEKRNIKVHKCKASMLISKVYIVPACICLVEATLLVTGLECVEVVISWVVDDDVVVAVVDDVTGMCVVVDDVTGI